MSWIRRETEKGTVQYICPRCHDYHEFREDFGERTFSENYIFCRRCGARNGTGNAPTLTPPTEWVSAKEKIEQLKNLEAIAYGYNINGEVLGMDCSDFEKIMVDAVEFITDLLARAEAAEARAEKAEKERDAAVSSFESFVKNEEYPCVYCKSSGVVCSGTTVEYCSSFEWCGQKEK